MQLMLVKRICDGNRSAQPLHPRFHFPSDSILINGKVIVYGICLEDTHSQWPSFPRVGPNTTSISWKKVEWDAFNVPLKDFVANTPAISFRCQSIRQTGFLQSFSLDSEKRQRGCPASLILS